MLFVQLMKVKAGTTKERIARRVEWQYPKGVRSIGEYWLQTNDPAVVAVYEADKIEAMMETNLAWSDYFDIAVFPAATAKEGLEIFRQLNK